MNTMETPACPFTCLHEETEVRRRRQANGVDVAVKQCLRCGQHRGSVPKKDTFFHKLPQWDEELQRSWQEQKDAWYREQGENKQREFWNLYYSHLRSDAWKALRWEVLKRCDWICQGCGKKEAVHVHHLTYDRLGDEMLFDLVGLCLACHEKIHGRELEVRG